MKFRVTLTILTMTLALLMTACAETPATVDSTDNTIPAADVTTAATAAITEVTALATTSTEAITTTTEVTTTEITTTTTTIAEQQPVMFVPNSSSPQFTLTLPASWEGRYTVREDASSVAFYELSNHQDSTQGKLFTIRYMQEDPDDIGFPSYRVLGEYNGTYAVVLFPTDVQYSVDLMDAYMNLYNELDTVLATFVYTG